MIICVKEKIQSDKIMRILNSRTSFVYYMFALNLMPLGPW